MFGRLSAPAMEDWDWADSEGTIAVTGAAGFIGTHVVAALLDQGFNVRACVRDSGNLEKTAHLTCLDGAAERLLLYSTDLNVPRSYDDAFRGADAVVHTAAVVGLTSGDPWKMVVNPSIEGTRNVLRSADRAKTIKRFVHTSSIAAIQSYNKAIDVS